MPNLVEAQIDSYKVLIDGGLGEVFKEFSSIKDYSGKKFELDFVGFKLGAPQYDEFYAKDNKLSYEAPLKVIVRLKNKTLGVTKEQEIFMADFPLMTHTVPLLLLVSNELLCHNLPDLSVFSLLPVNSRAKHFSEQKSFLHVVLGLKLNQKRMAHSMFELIESESFR
jgi:DNA-directed RNA polymerase beta subunit